MVRARRNMSIRDEDVTTRTMQEMVHGILSNAFDCLACSLRLNNFEDASVSPVEHLTCVHVVKSRALRIT